ncbi:sigma-70 family RNA polymerase sigma factor [Streptomyces sp. NPDC001130]
MAGSAVGTDVGTDADRYRSLLFSIAYGMTGSVGDAEDLVQDAFLNLTRARQAGTTVGNLKAYLTTSVTRLAINHLSSARVRRETYVGDWLPEPVVVSTERPGPAEHAELSDSLSMAFLVLLETLAPAERAVFVLREVFGYGYPDVARIVGKSEANCRQIFARAGKRIAPGGQPADLAPPPPVRRAEGEELAHFTTDAKGEATMTSHVKWAFRKGEANSVVIHANRTSTEPGMAGMAGDRLACLTAPFS